MARGNFTNHHKGEDNSLWKGGEAERSKRYHQTENGKLDTNLSSRSWYLANKDKWKVYHERARIRLKQEVLGYYGNGKLACARCGFDNERALSIDHINGGGNQHAKEVGFGMTMWYWLKRNKFPDGYQTLCMNCQFIKKSENHEQGIREE